MGSMYKGVYKESGLGSSALLIGSSKSRWGCDGDAYSSSAHTLQSTTHDISTAPCHSTTRHTTP
jgi:hypothetical protein